MPVTPVSRQNCASQSSVATSLFQKCTMCPTGTLLPSPAPRVPPPSPQACPQAPARGSPCLLPPPPHIQAHTEATGLALSPASLVFHPHCQAPNPGPLISPRQLPSQLLTGLLPSNLFTSPGTSKNNPNHITPLLKTTHYRIPIPSKAPLGPFSTRPLTLPSLHGLCAPAWGARSPWNATSPPPPL